MIDQGQLPLARRRPIVGRLPRIELRQHPHLRTSRGVRPLVTVSFLFAKTGAEHGQARLGESDDDHELDRQIMFKAQICSVVGVMEGTVRYDHRRQEAGTWTAVRGRNRPWPGSMRQSMLTCRQAERSRRESAELHSWLVAEHDYAAGLRSVQRYLLRAYFPPRRAQRRVEALPWVQAQANWAWFPRMRPGGARRGRLAWLSVHDAALQRPVGVPATVRIDNEKTAVVAGSRAWGPCRRATQRL